MSLEPIYGAQVTSSVLRRTSWTLTLDIRNRAKTRQLDVVAAPDATCTLPPRSPLSHCLNHLLPEPLLSVTAYSTTVTCLGKRPSSFFSPIDLLRTCMMPLQKSFSEGQSNSSRVCDPRAMVPMMQECPPNYDAASTMAKSKEQPRKWPSTATPSRTDIFQDKEQTAAVPVSCPSHRSGRWRRPASKEPDD
jgi:hypothetical protein